MFKRTLAGILALFLISTTGTVAYTVGDDDNTQNNTKIIQPINNLSTTDNSILLSGTAKQGSKIVVEVYSKKNFMKVDFDLESLTKEETEEDYVLTLTESFEVTEIKRFVHSLELSVGKHKIVIYVKENEEVITTITRYVIVNDKEDAKKEMDNVENESILDRLIIMYNAEKTNDSQ